VPFFEALPAVPSCGGGHKNPNPDARVKTLDLEDAEIAALVKFLEALTGESPKETPPSAFPR